MGKNYARSMKTYHQVHDTTHHHSPPSSKLRYLTKQLESELTTLKEKYRLLQNALDNREAQLKQLNQQLINKESYMARLEEDYEHAILQLAQRKKLSKEAV